MTQEPLHAVVYVSSASRQLNSDELDALLIDARNFNKDVGVTGALLYHDGSFFSISKALNQALMKFMNVSRNHVPITD